MEYHIVYAKFDGCKSFKAFDVNEGRQVGNPYTPHWLRIQKIPGQSFRNSQT